jgi:hypothetical protein
MRKVFAFAAVAGLLTFASCGEKKAESTETTETTVDTAAAPMEAVVDTAAVDTAAHAADTAAGHAEKM